LRKLLFLALAIPFSCAVHAQPNNDEAEMLGKWRVFASDHDVTAVLRAKDNSSDMDLYCDKTHLEVSVYLKKKPEDGELTKFAISVDGNDVNDQGWQSNVRTRSTTVKTANPAFIKKLSGHKEIVFTYSLENKPNINVAFDLSDIGTIIDRANGVCKLDLSQYE
jgi:hypothetical protein